MINRKGPWEGYERQAKRCLARCFLPAFLFANIFIERETSGYEAEITGYWQIRVRKRGGGEVKLGHRSPANMAALPSIFVNAVSFDHIYVMGNLQTLKM